MIRRQLPAYSPLSLGSLLHGALGIPSAGRSRGELEEHIADRFGAKRVVLTGSGTHALQIALASVPKAAGGSPLVALPAYSCFDLVTAALGATVRVVFYDVDPTSLTPDPESVEAALRAGPAALVAANAYGFPLDWHWLRRECDARGVLLVEDAAQGIGSTWAGREAGTFGDFSVLSFSRGKGWTGGGGGALVSRADQPDLVAALERSTKELGAVRPRPGSIEALVKSSAQWALGRPSVYGLPASIPGLGLGETVFKEPTPASPIPSFAAALALQTARAAAEEVEHRRRTARTMDGLLDSGGGVEVCRPLPGGESSFLRYPVLVGGPEERRDVLDRGARFGIGAGYPVALSRLPEARSASTNRGDSMPGAERLAASLVTLPTHRWVDGADLHDIVKLLGA